MREFRVTADAHQWIVNEVRVAGDKAKEPGKRSLVPVSYHPSLELAVRAASDRFLRDLCPSDGINVGVLLERLYALAAKRCGADTEAATPNE